MERSGFLERKYADLAGSEPVERAVQKEKRKEGKAPHTRSERIESYLNRLEKLVESPMGIEKKQGDRGGFELLKHKILEKYTTKYEDIPDGYWIALQEEARRRGEGGDWENADEEQKEEIKRKHSEIVLLDQQASLEQWVDYFGAPDSEHIPNDLKYWIFRNVLNLQELVKKKEGDREYIEFSKRSKGTVKPYPDINYDALSYVVNAIKNKFEGKEMEFEYDIQHDELKAFNNFLAKENFAKLYAWANELMNPVPEHLLTITEGKWVKFEQDSDPTELVKTIRGKGTGWCTAGLNTAKTHLSDGDFYVYYTLDDNQEPTIPRLAIRMEGNDKIAENPRGIAYKQNLDPYMPQILEEKLKEFGSVGEKYEKKSEDMKKLTEIENKTKQKQELKKEDLIFLYEIDSKIEGFGYKRDPRIEEIKKERNTKEDAPIVLECELEEIAWGEEDIKENTKAYIGKLCKGIFQKNFEHIYTEFPEGKIRKMEVEIGGKNKEELIKELKENFSVSDTAEEMLKNADFTVSEDKEKIDLVKLTDKDLGFTEEATTDEIYKRAKNFGLELCPAETGPHLRLQYKDQPMNEYLRVGMKQITNSSGEPRICLVYRSSSATWLDTRLAYPTVRWHLRRGLVLRFRKLET